MDGLSHALGAAQRARIEEIIAKRQKVAVTERFSAIPGVRLPFVAPEVTVMSWFVHVARVGADGPTPERYARGTTSWRGFGM